MRAVLCVCVCVWKRLPGIHCQFGLQVALALPCYKRSRIYSLDLWCAQQPALLCTLRASRCCSLGGLAKHFHWALTAATHRVLTQPPKRPPGSRTGLGAESHLGWRGGEGRTLRLPPPTTSRARERGRRSVCLGRGHSLGTWLRTWLQPPATWEALGKLLNISVPQFPAYEDNNVCFIPCW